MKWTYLDPAAVNAAMFGFRPVAVKVAKHSGRRDVRSLRARGWSLYAELTDVHPVNGQRMKASEWFVFAAKA